MKYRIMESRPLLVGKPNGKFMKKSVLLYHDTTAETFGLLYLDDGPLQGYSFDVLVSDTKWVLERGVWVDKLPGRNE